MKKFLNILFAVIDNGGQQAKGLPIGNLTSQFLANVYLDVFDHFIKDQCGIKYYLRYMDDFIIFSNDKNKLKTMRNRLKIYLEEQLHLELKKEATYINNALNGLSFLGMRIFPKLIRIKRENLKRSIRKLRLRKKQFFNNKISEQQWQNSSQSILEYLNIPNSRSLKQSLFIEAQA